ncbi:MAG: double-strand break repair helicase AddA [Proteobacteria bacterium]|nr:double-strand break repair helicase AddA [Pseudomonadota bacterium]
MRAADPVASTWLSANAGSGKTRVLTDRVARLLLQGEDPQRILCLTYTKAAASEMQNRLFQRLGSWAMLPDDALSRELEDLGADGALTADRLRTARTLFAAAIETPGGLKIQTIHSFCAGLLRRFPVEAGISPQFTEIEDRAAALLRAEIVDDMASGPEAGLIDAVAMLVGGSDLDRLTAIIAGLREGFATDRDMGDLLQMLGLPRDLTAEGIAAQVFTGREHDLFDHVIPVLEGSGTQDQGVAAKLRRIHALDYPALSVLEDALLTGAGAKEPFAPKLGKIPVKGVAKGHPDLVTDLDALMVRVADARPLRIGFDAARKADVLHRFARAFLEHYARRKLLRGWVDFDDLIGKALLLLSDPSVAQWVLYRLDGGIDHVLVDEAQDTSPAQWDVIEKLTQEFTSGEGARAAQRTLFVVGDKKQSIYSFQGADPREFDRMRGLFDTRLGGAGQVLRSLTLSWSFRSAHPILSVVDALFEGEAQAGFDDDAHRAFFDALPGRVDLWPLVEAGEDPEDGPWYQPLDRVSPLHPDVVLARAIADEIARLIAAQTAIPDGKGGARAVSEGDFLILVRRRSRLFEEIIRACKARNLRIAGADVLKVGAETAVKDLAAMMSFLATPEDDMSLAVTLRSPLLGWTEARLFDLAHRRGPGTFLWSALRDRRAEFPEALTILDDLRRQADFLRPYDLLERLLIRHQGRARLLARLGREAEDGIDALLSQALAYERSDVPSLTGFLVWMETDDQTVKRRIDAQSDQIRVMTVHGAKGLQAPIVILPDTAQRKAPNPDPVQNLHGVAMWRMAQDAAPDALIDARGAEDARAAAERLRLLYVALTRAEQWLIVAGAGKLDEKTGDTWYQRVDRGLTRQGAVTCPMPTGDGLRLQTGAWDGLALRDPEARAAPPDLPPLHDAPPPPLPETHETLSPSDLGGAKALPGEEGLDKAAAQDRGTQLHLLLEHLPALPREDWDSAAANLVGEASDLVEEVRGVLDAHALAPLFAPGTFAEVPVTAPVGGRRLFGVIDRLVVGPDRVLVVDYKSNRLVPDRPEDCPEGLLRQMGAYRAMLAPVFPDRRIDVAILWTRPAVLMPLPHESVQAALRRAPKLDLGAGPS